MNGNGVVLSENLRFSRSSLIKIAIIRRLLGFTGVGKAWSTDSRNQYIIIIVNQILHCIQCMTYSLEGNGFWFKQILANRHLLGSYTGFFKVNTVFRYPFCRSAVFGLHQTRIF